MKRALRRPSPAMVVAIVALIAALGGTAIAGGFITKKKAKKVANNQITKRAPGLAVASAANADAPFAYARVNSNGSLNGNAALTKNVSAPTAPGNGVYCFDLSFTPVHAQATSQAQSGSDDVAMVEVAGAVASLPGCPAGTDAEVRNFDEGAAVQQNDAFYVQFWK